MDAAGAQELQRRFDAHAHWRQAEAVRDGRQPAADPDAHELEESREGERIYRRSGGVRTVKRLVDGRWERMEIAEDERAGV
jgi:hypothetical protein